MFIYKRKQLSYLIAWSEVKKKKKGGSVISFQETLEEHLCEQIDSAHFYTLKNES